MSDDGERTCPLCAEEMDLTDQQLKPCKCGYEVRSLLCKNHSTSIACKSDTPLEHQGTYCLICFRNLYIIIQPCSNICIIVNKKDCRFDAV